MADAVLFLHLIGAVLPEVSPGSGVCKSKIFLTPFHRTSYPEFPETAPPDFQTLRYMLESSWQPPHRFSPTGPMPSTPQDRSRTPERPPPRKTPRRMACPLPHSRCSRM